ncbi:hypothetical protein LOTGIDRAFT_230654 [Lottia gigantea]|uniref:Prokineticin domain-containing protein n=1 Tax=Lottia gigantea TaxID=225164 RepID=V4B1S4_LOTGI|nr:hypothetical protein LOTGIDRAFT_230654 [Lottia gigantea]ESP01301.1 hypothetical protein LOTGIDRAFT_230654 [Lottia gigantea]
MKVVIALVLLSAVATQGFIFNSCKSDSDCNNGCCEHSFFNSRCLAKGAYLQRCSTSGCGCQAGLTCMKASEVTSVAIETHVGSNEYVCETQQKGAATTMPPMPTSS